MKRCQKTLWASKGAEEAVGFYIGPDAGTRPHFVLAEPAKLSKLPFLIFQRLHI